MDIDTALLRRTGLFQDMEDGDIRRLLDCLHCPVRRYGRGEFLWHAGDAVPMAGIVLEGCVDAVQYGEDGGASCCSCGTGGRRRAATISACPTPVRRWRRYWASTAAPCPVSWDGCSGRGCWNSTAAASG